MATTASSLAKSVRGDLRTEYWRLTPDATSTSFVTGLQDIYGMSVTIQSATTANAGWSINEGVSGTSIAGTVHMSGVASGDEYLVKVDGK